MLAACVQPFSNSRKRKRTLRDSKVSSISIMKANPEVDRSLAAYAHRDLGFPTLLETCSPLDRYFLSHGGAM